MTYVDAFVVSVKKDRVEDYKQLARETVPLWKEHGALSYVETLADEVPYGNLTSFPRAVMAEDDEVVILSWVTYPSKAVRDVGSRKVMADSRFQAIMEQLPVDGARMIFGGFEAFIEE